MEPINKISDFLRNIPVAFLIAIICVIGAILFLPLEIAELMALDGFREKYKVYLGPALLLSISFVIARVYLFLCRLYIKRRNKRRRVANLSLLTPEEKGYLVAFFRDQKHSIHVGPDDGVISSLVAKNIVYLASNSGHVLRGFPYNLTPWARQKLEENPVYLEGFLGKPLTPEERFFPGFL